MSNAIEYLFAASISLADQAARRQGGNRTAERQTLCAQLGETPGVMVRRFKPRWTAWADVSRAGQSKVSRRK